MARKNSVPNYSELITVTYLKMSKERIYENRKFIIYEKLYAFQISKENKCGGKS